MWIWRTFSSPFKYTGRKINELITTENREGIVDTFKNSRFRIFNNQVAQRINKTDEFYLNLSGIKYYYSGNELIMPKILSNLAENQAYESNKRLSLSIKGKEYTLEEIKLPGGVKKIKSDGCKLYQIKGFEDGIVEPDSTKITKLNVVWIDSNNRVSSFNEPGKSVKYNFKGKVKAFQPIDIDHQTKKINILGTILTVSIGFTAGTIKYLSYNGSNFIFNTIPKVLDRIIVPSLSLAIFVLTFLVVKPISFFLPEDAKRKISNFFINVYSFNRSVLIDGLNNHIKEKVLDSVSVKECLTALENGSLEMSSSEKASLYSKRFVIRTADLFSKILDFSNLFISNIGNVVASAMKGTCNSCLYVLHGFDKRYIQSAGYLFTKPFKIIKEEFGELLEQGNKKQISAKSQPSENIEIKTFLDKVEKKQPKEESFISFERDIKEAGKELRYFGMKEVEVGMPSYQPKALKQQMSRI